MDENTVKGPGRVLNLDQTEFDALLRAIKRVKARPGADGITDGQAVFVIAETYGLGVAPVPVEDIAPRPKVVTHDGMVQR